jgi:hypothetical protein
VEPGERYWQLIQSHWDLVEGADTFLRDFARTPEAVRNLLAAHWCQSEVCNGGFNQFFRNSTGVLAPEAADAFEAIGMPALAALVRRAAAFFRPDYIRTRDQRIVLLGRHMNRQPHAPDPFDGMDEEFYRLLREEDGGWDTRADRYAESHGG